MDDQSVMNAMARLIVQRRTFDPITAMIRIFDHLHWLPVTYSIIFTLCLLIYKSPHDCSDLPVGTCNTAFCQPIFAAPMAASVEGKLDAAEFKLVQYGNYSFDVSRPTAWNKLPSGIHDPSISLVCCCLTLNPLTAK